jgi:hypothetical protein
MTLTKTNSLPERFRPVFSPEHGVYVMLFVSLLTGAAAARDWTLPTTLASIATFFAFQAEHPLSLQIKQRKSWKPRFLVWFGIYGSIAAIIGGYLALQTPSLLWLYGGALGALGIDALAVFYRRQKSIANEFLTFAAVCLAVPFVYVATTGTWTLSLLGLWGLNTLFFASTIFTVKLRKPKTASIGPALLYHALATGAIALLWYAGLLGFITALAFGVAIVKFGAILLFQGWYRSTRIQNIAVLETVSALVFLAIVALSLLPARLG